MSKVCTKCGQEKSLENFHKNISHPTGYHVHCKTCRSEFSRKHVSRLSKESRRYALQRKFGISEEKYNDLLIDQNSCCAICQRHQSNLSRKLAVDHNHLTGQVRGLLCPNCNTGIGNLRDNTEMLEKAIKYLNSWKVLTE